MSYAENAKRRKLAKTVNKPDWFQNIEKQIKRETQELEQIQSISTPKQVVDVQHEEPPSNQESILQAAREKYNRYLEMKHRESIEKPKQTQPDPNDQAQMFEPVFGAKSQLLKVLRNSPQKSGSPRKLPKAQVEAAADIGDRLYAMHDVYSKKLAKKRVQKDRDEAAEMRKPQVSSRTEKLAKKMRLSSSKVETRLLNAGRQAAENRLQREEQALYEARLNAYPMITSQSAKLLREGDVAERLSHYHERYEARREERKRQAEPYYTFKPLVNKTNYWQKHHRKRLTRSHSNESLRKSRQDAKNRTHTYKPQLSRRSLKLASKKSPSMERLTTPRDTYELLEPDFTFSPRINQTSVEIDFKNSRIRGENRWEDLYNQGAAKRQGQSEIEYKHPKDIEDEQECTFAPSLHTRILMPSEEPVVNRLYNWHNEKQEKLRTEQAHKLTEGTEECTFTPDITKARISNDDPFFKSGTKEFFMRQEIARLRGLEKQMKLNRFSGGTWQNQITVPKAKPLRTERRTAEKQSTWRRKTADASVTFVRDLIQKSE